MRVGHGRVHEDIECPVNMSAKTESKEKITNKSRK